MAAIQLSILISSLFTEYGRIFITNSNDAATFLSIYSTIFAVNVALWALFSGVLDNSYMGISYVEYFFSMKPRIYKQKWVVLASLVVLIASCVCYLRGIYGFVGASLLFEIISIGVSTMSLYGIFKSPKLIKDEILQYSLEKQFEQKTEKETGKELLEDNYERISR